MTKPSMGGPFRWYSKKLLLLVGAAFLVFGLLSLSGLTSSSVPRPPIQASTHEPVIPLDSISNPNPAFLELAKKESCPACLGTEVCSNVKGGYLTLGNEIQQGVEPSDVVVYEGSLGSGEKLNVKFLSDSAQKKFDDLICTNSTLLPGCDVGKAIRRTAFFRNLAPSLQNLKQAQKFLGKPSTDIPLLSCSTPRISSLLLNTYDANEDGVVSLEEKVMLLSGLLLAPEVAVLKLVDRANLGVGTPRWVGSCGRVWITEGDLLPLHDFLQESFTIRAGLAAQLLSMVDDFMEEDPDWLFLALDLGWDNLAVNKDGDVVLRSLEHLMPMDKNQFEDGDEPTDEGKVICNGGCFRRFLSSLLSDHPDTQDLACGKAGTYAHVMYGLLCEQVLSDRTERPREPILNDREATSNVGLLHGAPSDSEETIIELLTECIEETGVGGRIQAAEELKELLLDLTGKPHHDDDDEDDNAHENYDDKDFDDNQVK